MEHRLEAMPDDWTRMLAPLVGVQQAVTVGNQATAWSVGALPA